MVSALLLGVGGAATALGVANSVRPPAAAETAPARTWQDACRRSGLALATDSRDLPFAMIYMLDESGRTATLSGVAGIDPSHPAAPATLSVESAMAWPLTPGQRGPRIVAELTKIFGCDFPSGI